MCGKFAMCNVLIQAKIPFTLTEDFTVSPSSDSFKKDLFNFAAICRVVDSMKSFNVGILNEKGIATACETDVSNAVMMRALALAADAPCTLLDFINNFRNDRNKALMFHCGPMAISMIKGKGKNRRGQSKGLCF